MTNITVDKATIELALEAIELNWRTDEGDAVTPLLRAALAEPAPVQEPSHDVVAGAIFDFAGFLTGHKVMIEVGSCSNASPMVERITEWAGIRGLSLEAPDVLGWQMHTPQPRKAVKLSKAEVNEIYNKWVAGTPDGTTFTDVLEQAVWAKLGVEE